MINLYGASGHCKVIIDIITNIGLTINKIYDDNKDVNEILNFKVTKSENLSKSENEFFIIYSHRHYYFLFYGIYGMVYPQICNAWFYVVFS